LGCAAGNVKLQPELLQKHQAYVKEQLKTDDDRPVFLVFHGGSGSTKSEITTAVKAGVVKMNVSRALSMRCEGITAQYADASMCVNVDRLIPTLSGATWSDSETTSRRMQTT
jgi:fructose/tagatose bisphosphate aldolase